MESTATSNETPPVGRPALAIYLRAKAWAGLLLVALLLGYQLWACLPVRIQAFRRVSFDRRMDRLEMSRDQRIANALDGIEPKGRVMPAYVAIREKTPERAVVSVFASLDPIRRMAMRLLLHPRRTDGYDVLTDYYLAHPKELDQNVYVVSLVPETPIPMAEWFQEIERTPHYVLFRYRGQPK